VLTFKDLKLQALTLLDQAADIATGNTGETLVGNAIAMAHEQRLLKDRWSFMLWPQPITLTMQTGVRVYTLHELAAMVTEFQDITAGQLMKDTPKRARYKFSGGLGSVQGDQYHFEFVQESPIQLPFAAGKLTVSAGNCIIRYIDTSQNTHVDTLAPAQLTSQPVSAVYGVTKTDANPLVIVDSASKTVLSLGATEYGKSYPQIRLFSDPNGGDICSYRFYRRPNTLVNDNDIPEIPYPFSRVLVYDALLELYTYNDAAPPPYWTKKQEEWDMLLRQTYQEGEDAGSETRSINETDTYGG
jgi:hypothetical protein